MNQFVTRFAPSPTGYLHRGHAYSALIAWRAARSVGGRFCLRIEDIDTTRCRPEFEPALLEDLEWLGIDWDPPILRQSDRFETYAKTLRRLREEGLIYRCFKSRKEIQSILSAPHMPPGTPFVGIPLSHRAERDRIDAGEPFSWRLSLSAARHFLGEDNYDTLTYKVEDPATGIRSHSPARPDRHGDVILSRKDVGTSYHIASVTDDIETDVTHVIRGQDLADVAGLHALLYHLLGADPPTYRHHRLITDAMGRRLAKRDRNETLQAIRQSGVDAETLRASLFGGDDPVSLPTPLPLK